MDYGLPRKIMCDAGSNFISDKLQEFSRMLKIHHVVSLSYNHQSNRQVKACIKFIKCTTKKCFDTNKDVNLALSHMRSTLIGNGLPSPAIILFKRPIRGLLPTINRTTIIYDYDDKQIEALKQQWADKCDTGKDFTIIL